MSAFPLVDAELFTGFSDRPQRRHTVEQPEPEVEGERGRHRWDGCDQLGGEQWEFSRTWI